jgi:hypothetical protein
MDEIIRGILTNIGGVKGILTGAAEVAIFFVVVVIALSVVAALVDTVSIWIKRGIEKFRDPPAQTLDLSRADIADLPAIREDIKALRLLVLQMEDHLKLEDHLKELLQDTPSGRMKLLATWDALSLETQMKLLHALTANPRVGLHSDIALKALESPHAYVRYLAARAMYIRDEDRERIATDVSPLVQYAQEEGSMIPPIGVGPQKFYAYPMAQKLAIMRSAAPPDAGTFAEWMVWAIEHQHAGDEELLGVVAEYVRNPKAMTPQKSSPYDGYGWYLQKKGFEALWKLVCKAPPKTAFELVTHLPATERGLNLNSVLVPEEVLEWLHDYSLEYFLYRQDVEMKDFRKKVFFSTDNRYTESTKSAAVCFHFDLTFEEFHRLLQEHSALLKILLDSRSLPLVFFAALKDYFEREEEESLFMTNAENAMYAFQHRTKTLEGEQRDTELRQVKIYHLARAVMPWNMQAPQLTSLSEAFTFLGEKTVAGDSWATFMAFYDALRDHRLDHLLLDYLL